MTKASFWRKDWFLGLGVSLVLLVASGAQLQLIEGLERFAYDWGVRASARTPSDRISVIAIDRKSTRLNSSHSQISYAVFCLKKKKTSTTIPSSTKDMCISWTYY